MDIYVGNLSVQITDKHLEELFTAYGNVESTKIIKDMHSGRSKGFGFVRMEKSECALNAIDALNNYNFYNQRIIVNEARSGNESNSSGQTC